MTELLARAGITLPSRRRSLSWAVIAVAGWLAVSNFLGNARTSHTHSGHFEIPFPVVVLGLIIGLTYGLLAVGLVLIYRSNRIINFAHGQIGAFGAAFFGIAVTVWHIPYWIAFIPALALSGATGALTEVAVIRRLRKAPLIMSVVATIGAGQFLVLFAYAFNSKAQTGSLYPQPTGLPSFHVGTLLVTPAYTGMLLLSPVAVLALGLFLKFSRFGLGIRGAAANPEAARMSGVFARRMSSLSWALAGSLAAFTAILTQPTRGFSGGDTFGPGLLLLALTGAVLARMSSLPVAVLAGVGLGVLEQVLFWNYAQAGVTQLALFVIILAAVLLQKQRVGRAEERGSWAAVQAVHALPSAFQRVWLIRHMAVLVAVPALVLAVVLPQLITNQSSVKLTGIFGFAIVGLSVGIITGLGGQLSLGQFAIGGIGAVASYAVSTRTDSVAMGFLYSGMTAAVVSVLIGLPALRVRGLLLTVTTLSFALVVPGYLLQQSWLLGDGKEPLRPSIAGHTLDSGRSYYYVGLATLVGALVLCHNVRRGGIGRLLVAVRDNEDNARAFTVSATRVKLQGFALAGFVAGLGAAVYGHSLAQIGSTSFQTSGSIDVVKMTVIGGLSMLTGPLLGAFFVQGTSFLPLDSAALAATSLGQLLIILYIPRGIAQLIVPARDRIAGALARRAGIDVEAAYAQERGFDTVGGSLDGEPVSADESLIQTAAGHDGVVASPVLVAAHRRPAEAEHLLLSARDLRKSFGGVRAVRGVSFDVMDGETVGLIGPNGAGKTTTFELLAGFVKPDTGTVEFDSKDVTLLGPEARAKRGLIRSFQDAALFPTLSVQECVQLALERTDPTVFASGVLGLRGQERRKQQNARDLVGWMGLDRYRSSTIQELSTGTRRITEIACLVAMQPRLLLLDEPASGVAQRETEALGSLLERLREDLGLTLVIIEHDIPMIMQLADRILCMADGEIIAAGTPEIIRTDPAVVEAYLGGSIDAIERSGPTAGRPARPVAVNGHGRNGAAYPLPQIPGLGPQRGAALQAAFPRITDLAGASVADVASVRGIGDDLAQRVLAALQARSTDHDRRDPTAGKVTR